MILARIIPMSTRWIVLINGTPAEIHDTETGAYWHATSLTWHGIQHVTVEELHFPHGPDGLAEDR